MNIQKPYKLNEIDLDKLVYTTIKQTDRKKVILLKYNEKGKQKNLVFQSPTLLNIFAPKMFMNNDIGYAELDVAMIGKNSSKVSKFIDFVNKLETKIKDDGKENWAQWFNINQSSSELRFQNIIRPCNKYTNGKMKIKLLKNHNFDTIIQYNNRHKTQIDNIPDNCWIKMLLEVYAIWINPNNDFGIFLRPVLVSYIKNNYNYSFEPETEEEDINDIPDTEVNNNIFIKMNKDPYDYSNDPVSQTSNLELNSSILNMNTTTSHTENDNKEKYTETDEKVINNNVDKTNDEKPIDTDEKLSDTDEKATDTNATSSTSE